MSTATPTVVGPTLPSGSFTQSLTQTLPQTPVPQSNPGWHTAIVDGHAVCVNGTQGQVYTQSVSAYDAKAAEKQRRAMLQVQACASDIFSCAVVTGANNGWGVTGEAEGHVGPVGGKASIDADGNAKVEPKDIDLDEATSAGAKGTVCVRWGGKDPKDEKGLKFKAFGGKMKIAPDGTCFTSPEFSAGIGK
jgi:hypothetical protein